MWTTYLLLMTPIYNFCHVNEINEILIKAKSQPNTSNYHLP